MKKNIDIPDDVRWDLEILAKQEKKDLKTFIQDILISLVRGKNNMDNEIKMFILRKLEEAEELIHFGNSSEKAKGQGIKKTINELKEVQRKHIEEQHRLYKL